ncbi:hypothetical protein BOX15_Mlig030577g2, partial [Macrostomum lignano]
LYAAPAMQFALTARQLFQSGCRSQLQSRRVDAAGASAAVALAIRYRKYCTAAPAAKKPSRRGYIVTCAVGSNAKQQRRQPAVLSDACADLQRRFGRDVAAMVESAARPAKPGQLLLLPGGLGRDADGFVVDLCVVGIAADAEHGGLAERVTAGAEPLEPWEARDDRRSVVRQAVTALRDLGCRQVMLDSGIAPSGAENADAAADVAEAAQSSALVYRRAPPKRPLVTDDADADETAPTLIGRIHGNSGNNSEAWDYGLTLGLAEARARDLMERPANLCTPSWFCQQAVEAAAALGPSVEVAVHDEDWIRERAMGGLLAVAKGSKEPPRFLVAKYNGRPESLNEGGGPAVADVCLIGKGVTFDSGGISIKPSANMADMRGDMGGAAVAFSSFLAACQLGLPLRLALCVPLCENMPDGAAVKPGDVIDLAGGRVTCRVDNTDAEGRLILADALHFAANSGAQPPRLIVDLATLTGAIAVALGGQRAGLFANRSARLTGFERRLLDSGFNRGDPLHQMPTDRRYRAAVQDRSGLADLSNIGTPDRMAGACTAAAFLSHFVPPSIPWMHIDMAGVMDSDGGGGSGGGKKMSGRPTRAVVDFLRSLTIEGFPAGK